MCSEELLTSETRTIISMYDQLVEYQKLLSKLDYDSNRINDLISYFQSILEWY